MSAAEEVEVFEVGTELNGFRGPRPGRPRKGEETKTKFHDRVAEDETYREIVNVQAQEQSMDLFNAADPSVPIIREKFEHRVLAYMRAQGLTRKEIFIRLGGEYDAKGKPVSGTAKYSYTHLGNIFAQPWFRRKVVELQHEAGLDQVEAAIAAELPSAVETVVEIMNDIKASHTARLSAATQLLDRGLGRPVQRVEQNNTNSHTHVIEDARVIDRELEALDQELKQLGAS